MHLPQLFKEPLLHFVILGFVLFVVFGEPMPQSDITKIEVTRPALVSFIQYKSKMLEPEMASDILQALSLEDLSNLIDEYVREEALYREALSLGLEARDPIIRKRLIQKLELLAETGPRPNEPKTEELIEYYQRNKKDYAQPASISFSHVFIRTSDQDMQSAQTRAKELLHTLRQAEAGFRDATAYGEHFLYHTNYVKRTSDTIAADFGAGFAQALFSETTTMSKWTGPLTSKHGLHLVFVVERTPAQTPPYKVMQDRIRHDFLREAQRQSSQFFIGQIQSKYQTNIAPDLQTTGSIPD
ncbi:MAG: hypothetical protein COA47_03190 [Robiginitomaculum sp.]|nr:MAG: hypothetical protein COA47_03190 [Robiginitomaculum sp.]